MKIAWFPKPPYVTGSPNISLENEARGIIGDVLLPEVLKCYHYKIQIDTIRVKHESDIFQKLKSGQAGAGGPVIAKGIDPTTYSGLAFIPMVDYPGADFITMAEPKQFAEVATEAVFNSWPLIAFTLILTAIAGVVTWALVSYHVIRITYGRYSCYVISVCWKKRVRVNKQKVCMYHSSVRN